MKKLLVFTITFFSLQLVSAQIWTQLGIDIDGEAANDLSGYSVSLSSDGKTVAIGAKYNNGNGSGSGHVRAYHLNGNTWIQKGLDIDGEAAGDEFGFSVALASDGNTMAVGAPWNDGNTGSNSGHVRIYRWTGTAWVQKGLDIDGEAAYDLSGWSVSLSSDGNTVAIGAKENDGNGSGSGHVRIYSWNGSTSWVQKGLDIDGDNNGDNCGWSTDISSDGNTIIIGIPYDDGNNLSFPGSARVYEWDGSTWGPKGKSIEGETGNDLCGWSVDMSADGNKVIVGSINNDWNGSNAGHARVYTWNGITWTQKGIDIDGVNAGDRFGWAVSISSNGNTVAAGTPFKSPSGYVQAYNWNGSTWIQKGIDINGEFPGDDAGTSISLSPSGDTLAIGATKNDANGAESGHTRIYHFGSSVNIFEFANAELQIYPNPTNGIITINTNDIIANEITITDVVGKTILSQKPQSTIIKVDFKNYNSGIYFVKIKIANEVNTTKIIKQ